MSETTTQNNQVSSDLIWEIVRNQNAFLVKRKTGGGIQFSRDPFNVGGVHSRKHAGFINEKAVGVLPSSKGGVTLITKKPKYAQQPALHTQTTTIGGNKSTRKTYKTIASSVAKFNYRSDLRKEAVGRASQIRASQRSPKEKKVTNTRKPRGAKAKREAAAKEGAED